MRSRLGQYAKEHWKETFSDLAALSSLIGKAGVKINQMRTDTGANIEVNLDIGFVRVTGSEEAVIKAKEAITTALEGHLDNSTVIKMNVPMAAFPLIVGKKGVTIQELQTLSDVRRIEVDRGSEQVIIRGR